MIIQIISVVIGFVFLIFLIGSIFIQTVRVTGGSMSPSYLHGDRLLIFKYLHPFFLQKGHVVVIDKLLLNGNLQNSKYYLKRIAGINGDTVRISIDEIDHINFDEIKVYRIEGNELIYNVPEGSCFVRGDNKMSIDSIVWGFVPVKAIKGILLLRIPSATNR